MVERHDWLLVFLGLPEGAYDTDQLRIIKGMFLFCQRCSPAYQRMYEFRPDRYGPLAPAIYRDLEVLQREGYVDSRFTTANIRRYWLTDKGTSRMITALFNIPADDLRVLSACKELVTSLAFRPLLRRVYAEYPEYAVNSVVRESLNDDEDLKARRASPTKCP